MGSPESKSSATKTRFPCGLLLAVLLVTCVVIAYLPAIQGGFIWDDDSYVTKNRTLNGLGGLKKVWLEPTASPQYYPLVFTTFWIEHYLWQLRPLGYHLVNVLLHAANALLLCAVLRRIRVPGAWAAAFLFALHPVQVESAAWITERKNVLSCVFYLCSLLAFLRYYRLGAAGDEPREPGSRRFYVLALALYVCALFSKTVTCSLPVGILLVLWYRGRRLGSRAFLALTPFFAVGLALGLVTVWMEKHTVGAAGVEWSQTFTERYLLAGRVVCFYAGKLIWPSDLAFIYPRWPIRAVALWQYLFPLGVGAAIALLWLGRKRLGRGPFAAALFYVATLGPALGFINVFPMRYSWVADHFQYLATLGAAALAGGGIGLLLGLRSAAARRSTLAALTVVVVVFGFLTWRQAHVYEGLETLWRDTLAKNPDAWIAHNNLGNILKRQGKHREAIQHYNATVRLNPRVTEVYANMGAALVELGQPARAVEALKKSLELRPDYLLPRHSLGVAYQRLGKLDEAAECFEMVLDKAPKYETAKNNLRIVRDRQKRAAESFKAFEMRLEEDPDDADVYNQWGVRLFSLDAVGEALARFEEALRIDPDYVPALNNYGIALARLERWEEAAAAHERALGLKPGDAAAQYSLGKIRDHAGDAEGAKGFFRGAIGSDPDHGGAHNDLAVLLAGEGDLDGAVRHFEEAFRISPKSAQARYNLRRAQMEQSEGE